jgi:thiol-disulfide isomerase/thioredoxin
MCANPSTTRGAYVATRAGANAREKIQRRARDVVVVRRRCARARGAVDEGATEGDVADDVATPSSTTPTAASTSSSTAQISEFPTVEEARRRGKTIALAGFTTGAAAYALSFGLGSSGLNTDAVAGANLATLEKASTPLELALTNGKPTVLEFYADWCEVCKESAPTVYAVEREHEKVNFVMLNIDNSRWGEEMDTYGVDGIPHLEFLDAKGASEGFIVGKFPKEVLESNVRALEAGETTLPYAKKYGTASAVAAVNIAEAPAQSADPRAPVSSADPRFHG